MLSGKGFKLELHCIHALSPSQDLNMGQIVLPAYNACFDCFVPASALRQVLVDVVTLLTQCNTVQYAA